MQHDTLGCCQDLHISHLMRCLTLSSPRQSSVISVLEQVFFSVFGLFFFFFYEKSTSSKCLSTLGRVSTSYNILNLGGDISMHLRRTSGLQSYTLRPKDYGHLTIMHYKLVEHPTQNLIPPCCHNNFHSSGKVFH